MSTIKRILVATDFSKSAGFALKRALQFSEKSKSPLAILHVFREGWLDRLIQKVSKNKNSQFLELKRSAQKTFNQKIKPQFAKVKSKFVVKLGREDQEIVQYAKDKKFDLMVVGAHGHYYFHEYFLGTTAESIVKNALCPVLVVKKKPNFTYNKIIIPIDFSSASKQALQYACNLFPNADIHVLHVEYLWYDQPSDLLYTKYRREGRLHKELRDTLIGKMNNFIKQCDVNDHQISTILRGGYPAMVIANEVNKKNFDLVIIGTRGQTKLRYLLIGSVAERVLQEVATDIIAVPPR